MKLPEESLGFLLNDVSRLMRRNYTRRAQGLGLSLAQWRALAYLARQEGVKQVTLAESLEIQPITLARLVDRLEEAGLVTRRPDPDDRRAIRLYLTPQAEPLLNQMWDLAAQTHEDALADLSDEARNALLQALQKTKQSLLKAEACQESSPDEEAERSQNVPKRA